MVLENEDGFELAECGATVMRNDIAVINAAIEAIQAARKVIFPADDAPDNIRNDRYWTRLGDKFDDLEESLAYHSLMKASMI